MEEYKHHPSAGLAAREGSLDSVTRSFPWILGKEEGQPWVRGVKPSPRKLELRGDKFHPAGAAPEPRCEFAGLEMGKVAQNNHLEDGNGRWALDKPLTPV